MRTFISAMRTLTAIPVPGKDCEKYEDVLYAFPLVGLVLGAILLLIAQTTGWLPIAVVAVLMLVIQTLLTRGFHLDGIADAADGFGGGYTKERSLEIMKDSQIGAFGSIALVLTLLMKAALFFSLLQADAAWCIVAAMVVSRTAQVFQCVTLPYARPSGTAAASVQQATTRHLGVALALCAALLLLKGIIGLALLPIGLAAAFLWGLYCKKRVGGITGDLLGATNEGVEITVLTGALILI
ncbi:MAG: adenosylcobinamide-GDP ribazoletransferase [Verrucomicrobiota bacterium]